jgi:uncharacterized membrane protein HdeD (DUF308 family)
MSCQQKDRDMATNLASAVVEPGAGRSRVWLLGVGVTALILGLAGLVMTLAFTVASVVWYGVLLIVAGAAQVIEVMLPPQAGGRWTSRALRLSLGLLYVAAGLYSAFHPEGASFALTLVLGILLIASGAVRAAWVLAREGQRSRRLGILLALVSCAFGIAVLSQWPLSGLWVIGLCLSADLIAYGLSWCWASYEGGRSA